MHEMFQDEGVTVDNLSKVSSPAIAVLVQPVKDNFHQLGLEVGLKNVGR